MAQTFNVNRFRGTKNISRQYELQLCRLRKDKKQVDCIEAAVRGALLNLNQRDCRSFVIYGEPQSGKTEMMICLTARLLDDNHRFIVHLLNDSVDLLGQNLLRFKISGLAPSARNFSEILDPVIDIKSTQQVVFCKKNGSDLRKLIDRISGIDKVIVIDDEADYASPNSKVNKGEKTTINDLIEKIIGPKGVYIGVTATPARLDLNNTFKNDSSLWVNFPPHSTYTGQDTFFPLDIESPAKYILSPLPDAWDNPKFARTALFSFLVNVAYLNNYGNNEKEENYSFLVHTSGKKADHKNDWNTIHNALNALLDRNSKDFERYVEEIFEISAKRYLDADPDKLTHYVLDNISRHTIIVLNSERDWNLKGASATNPTSLFTIIIGGNIVSRGVTLDNLLSMFFTRDVKHKIQQDTYIQRARMFGARGKYLRFFELTIPQSLYTDWHRCFVFHRLALEAINQGLGSLVWLGDSRVTPVSSSSIDRSTVDLDKGEMAFQLFDYNPNLEPIVGSSESSFKKMQDLCELIGEDAFPVYLQRYVQRVCPNGSSSIAFHPSFSIDGYKSRDGLDMERIERRRGFMGQSDLQRSKYPNAIHHFKVYYNGNGKARLLYKFDGSIQFIKNLRHDS